MRIDFQCLTIQYSFRLGSDFLASMDLEKIITLVFSGLSLILHLAHHIANFRRSCCKRAAAVLTLRLKDTEQYHQQIGIRSFGGGVVVVGH